MLQVDQPKFAGRALYWFNEPIISSGVLVNIALNSRKSLGERFTPEFHIDLPIANKFECLGLIIDAINEGVNRDSWYDNIVRFLSELGDFHNIAVVLSCRSTYKDFLIPKELTGDTIPFDVL